MPRHLRAALVVALALPLASPAAAGARPIDADRSWASGSIRLVLDRGILPGVTSATFRPQRAVNGWLLGSLVRGAFRRSADGSRTPSGAALSTIGGLDAAFVVAAGLGPDADAARDALARAGYHPRRDAGTEITARILGLRYNHPAGSDALEHSADELATRAEAAYTTAKVLGWRGWEPDYARAILRRLQGLPTTTGARHDALDRAIGFLGQPYVWAGEWETPKGPLGPQAHGGFDCSGLIWRVMALDPASPPGIAKLLGGRATYGMAAMPGPRLKRAQVRPGDLLLFGSRGPASSSGEVYHAGIDLGNGLMIHSSTQGVQISRWDEGYHASVFAWGRSILPD